MTSHASASLQLLECVLDHVLLPARLPSAEDPNLFEVGRYLNHALLEAVTSLRDVSDARFYAQLDSLRRVLESTERVNFTPNGVEAASLACEIKRLNPGDSLIIHVIEQNAGLHIQCLDRPNGASAVIDAFEASPLSHKVLASSNALKWNFPGSSIIMDWRQFAHSDFLAPMCKFLEQANSEAIKRFAAHTVKAGASVPEIRQPADPHLISQVFMTLLEARGQQNAPIHLQKRIRDEALWSDGALKPWRRSPFWLVLRVGVQQELHRTLGPEVGYVHYKFLLCSLLARLIKRASAVHPETLIHIRAKLTRRLEKLRTRQSLLGPAGSSATGSLFRALNSELVSSISLASDQIDRSWTTQKNRLLKRVPRLKHQINPNNEAEAVTLQLTNSKQYLLDIVEAHRSVQGVARNVNVRQYEHVQNDISKVSAQYFRLLEQEQALLEQAHCPIPNDESELIDHCQELASCISKYLAASAGCYDCCPSRKSESILLIMELWVVLDKSCVILFPLLESFSPSFIPETFDILQLRHIEDMDRLLCIQSYLRSRQKKCCNEKTTIFDAPGPNSFAVRYYGTSTVMQELHQQILADSREAREEKAAELIRSSADYDAMIQELGQLECVYKEEQTYIGGTTAREHDYRNCRKCFLSRTTRRMRISIHEDFLPSDEFHASGLIFELACPPGFGLYRDTTWSVISRLGMIKSTGKTACGATLNDLSQLSRYYDWGRYDTSVSLASTTKPFKRTHYSEVRFPARVEDVCLRNGLNMAMYDKSSQFWLRDWDRSTSLKQELRLVLPSTSAFASLQSQGYFTADPEGPTSNEVIASQTECPEALNVYEYMAFQELCSGQETRWLKLLVELGSANLNFSNEAVLILIDRVSNIAGPITDDDDFRVAHRIFKDPSFCIRLASLIQSKLDSIKSSWREAYCMAIVLNLSLRLWSLTKKHALVKHLAFELIFKAREILHEWMSMLQYEILTATSAEISQHRSMNMIWSAILCKRTFEVLAGTNATFDRTGLRIYVESSIRLAENLGSEWKSLVVSLQDALIRDRQLSFVLKSQLQSSIETTPAALADAIASVWPGLLGWSQHSFNLRTRIPSHPCEWLYGSVQGNDYTSEQIIQYHILEGHLIVNGKPLGKLPDKLRSSEAMMSLFPDQNILVYPSGMQGMEYVLQHTPEGSRIHCGMRDGKVIVRAVTASDILELVPPSIFGQDPDLPQPLIASCKHWLDVETGTVVIRRDTNVWTTKSEDWELNVLSGRASRQKSILISPQSRLFRDISMVFSHFEHPRHIVASTSKNRQIHIELPRMDLKFYVNKNGRVQFENETFEVDANQDAGCWYGVLSKIVFCSVHNTNERMVLVPLGLPSWKRSFTHVSITIAAHPRCGRFIINKTLGRLDCTSEPSLLYQKAVLHALSSFPVLDPLTRRTGTEEAMEMLASAAFQPWSPLSTEVHKVLSVLSKLSPVRNYYPSSMAVMEKVQWNPDLNVSIQNDGYRTLVENIVTHSEKLRMFSRSTGAVHTLQQTTIKHLQVRARWRRQAISRWTNSPFILTDLRDDDYSSRDRPQHGQERFNIYEVVRSISEGSVRCPQSFDVRQTFQQWRLIGGFDRVHKTGSLSSLLDVEIGSVWGSLVQLCRKALSPTELIQMMFYLSVISFNADIDMNVVRILIAYCTSKSFKDLKLPANSTFEKYCPGEQPQEPLLLPLIRDASIPFTADEDVRSTFGLSMEARRVRAQREASHKEQMHRDLKIFLKHLVPQWPCSEPKLEGFSTNVLIHCSQAIENIKPGWKRMFENRALDRHLMELECIIRKEFQIDQIRPPDIFLTGTSRIVPRVDFKLPSLVDMLCESNFDTTKYSESRTNFSPMIQNPKSRANPKSHAERSSALAEISELREIITNFAKSSSGVRAAYGKDLLRSVEAFERLQDQKVEDQMAFDGTRRESLETLKSAENVCNDLLDILTNKLRSQDSGHWLRMGNLLPCMSVVSLLENLRSTTDVASGRGVKDFLVHYAVSVTALQRQRRIHRALCRDNKASVLDERENLGHSNWDPKDYPDWLLLEIDSDLLLRPIQVEVALATIAPRSGCNSVLQMNMGQGKTSCIIPMVATVLANSRRLSRVIVPKPLLLQMAQILQARLGFLLGRRSIHVPFSRRTSVDHHTLSVFHELHSSIKTESGIILALPEHVMSFQLSGLQRLADGKLDEGVKMLEIQNWLSSVARDVLDESDYTLSVRTQLIYPSGSHSIVDGHPHRWTTMQTVLRGVKAHARALADKYPESLKVVSRRDESFPVVHFIRPDAEEAMSRLLVDDICEGRMPLLSVNDLTAAQLDDIRHFLLQPIVQSDLMIRIDAVFADCTFEQQNLYLVRGLLVHRVLFLALSKRWNIQYGIDPRRDPMAVPFFAKDQPSEQSEWGHADVSIMLTCLSFYYGGLTERYLRESFQHLQKADNPYVEFDRWVHHSRGIPSNLRDWNAINLDDEGQFQELFGHFSHVTVVIDYFLNYSVFPRFARQFEVKMQTSGWDLPQFDSCIIEEGASSNLRTSSKPLTTGFSGTNDNKTLLPLTIKQDDLPTLSHTSAEVLTYLLQPRNRQYVPMLTGGDRWTEDQFLETLKVSGIRVLIDSGAFILEKSNRDLARDWLSIDHEAEAVVFFDNDRAVLRHRKGKEVPLLASPYVEDLGKCLVYIDEAHTRGTDMKFPNGTTGALTLGPHQTKDHTVQAAMRLRRLATTHSLVFYAPAEVHQSILDTVENKRYGKLDSNDVVTWLLEQTSVGIEQLIPLYYAQGKDFCRRKQAWYDHRNIARSTTERVKYLKSLKTEENHKVEALYAPKCKLKPGEKQYFKVPSLRKFMDALDTSCRGIEHDGMASQVNAIQEIEQERELAVEVEVVRQIQKQTRHKALKFVGLHRDIKNFAETGKLSFPSSSYENAFDILKRTALGSKHGISAALLKWRIFVSLEFNRTVELPAGQTNDTFQRQPRWLLWSPNHEIALIISPEEAEILLPKLRSMRKASTHLLTYAAPVTRHMLHFDNLTYYAVPALRNGWVAPAWLRTALGIFAGRMYFKFEDYPSILGFMGINYPEMLRWTTPKVATGLEYHSKQGVTGIFAKKPLMFMKDWLALRRAGQDLDTSPMGYICQGISLHERHHFFISSSQPSTKPTENRTQWRIKGYTDEEKKIGADMEHQGDE